MQKIVITGAGGFIGSHLVAFLKEKGFWVRGVDLKEPEFGETKADDFQLLDLRCKDQAMKATEGADTAFLLAANMGGIGWTHAAPAEIMHDNLMISANSLDACRLNGVQSLLYASSACVYPNYLQEANDSPGLAEDKVFPADPDMEYGWEKLTSEILHEAYRKSYGMNIRIARFHNIYGPLGTYDGGAKNRLRPSAEKIAMIEGNEGEVEVWGNGTQARSYCYIDDCIEGLWRVINSDLDRPINVGSDTMLTINELVAIVARIAGKKVTCTYDLSKPVGPMGRNSDNTLIKKLLKWAPDTDLAVGMKATYEWIAAEIGRRRTARNSAT